LSGNTTTLATINNPTPEKLHEGFYAEHGFSIENDNLLHFVATPTFIKHCEELKISNQRLYEQDGAFFICSNIVENGMITSNLVTLDSVLPSMIIRIPYEYKSHIKTELNEKHGINAASIYPELPAVSAYLKEKYKRKAISLDDKYEIVKSNVNENMRGRRWAEFFIILKMDKSGTFVCGRSYPNCKDRHLTIDNIKEIVRQIVQKNRNSSEVISIFVANSNEDYVSVNWILRAQWISPQLTGFLKPMSIGVTDEDDISWVENKSYSVNAEFYENHSFVDDTHLYVYNYKAYQIFKNAYAEMKKAYQQMSILDFLQERIKWETAIAQCSRDFGDFGISKNKDFNDFLEAFLTVSGAADNLRMYRTYKDRTPQNLERLVKYDFDDIEKHLPIIENGLHEWRVQISVADTDIESINFQKQKKPLFTFTQTIPVSENALVVFINESKAKTRTWL